MSTLTKEYKMRKEYAAELKELSIKMGKAEAYAKKIPIFQEQIINRKLTGEEDNASFGNSYKNIYLSWGISRLFYSPGKRSITNSHKSHEGYLFNIYVNSYSLFNVNENFNLYCRLENINVFFKDTLNSTFYIEDKYIHDFLEALNDWYIKALKELDVFRLAERKSILLKELESIEKRNA